MTIRIACLVCDGEITDVINVTDIDHRRLLETISGDKHTDNHIVDMLMTAKEHRGRVFFTETELTYSEILAIRDESPSEFLSSLLDYSREIVNFER